MKLSAFYIMQWIIVCERKKKSKTRCSWPDHTWSKMWALHTFMPSKSWNHREGHWRLGSKTINFCFGNDVKAKHLFCLFPGKQSAVLGHCTQRTGAGNHWKEKKFNALDKLHEKKQIFGWKRLCKKHGYHFFTELDEIGAADQIGNDLCTTFETTHPDNL